ncbi:MAG: hypothetical protein IJQ23_06295 [Clostridia bacterium]|nr:hypothetical protein [Clostridia bacterium]MBR0189978.1 hypothetical protein [Clostridia bacterium]
MKTNDKRFIIQAFIPPNHGDEKALQTYKDCGFTHCQMTEDTFKISDPEYCNSLKRMEKIGLDAVIVNYRLKTPQYLEGLKKINFNDYPAVKMINAIDEPTEEMLDAVEKYYVPWYNENYADTDIAWFMNTYGGAVEDTGVKNYKKHIDSCIERLNNKINTKNKFFSIDNYPLRQKEGWKRYLLDECLLMGLSYTAKKVQDNGARFGTCIQAYDGWSNLRFPLDIFDIRFQVFTSLAFGATVFTYFIYKSTEQIHYMFRGMVTMDGRLRPLYYDVQKMNSELKTFEEEFLTFKWLGASFYEGKENNGEKRAAFTLARKQMDYTDDRILNVESDRDFIIGSFAKDNSKAYIFVDFNEPSKKAKNKIAVDFKDATKARMNLHGEETVVELNNGKFEIELEAGDGLFLVID